MASAAPIRSRLDPIAPAARFALSRSARALRRRISLLATKRAKLERVRRDPGRRTRPSLPLDHLIQRRARGMRITIRPLKVVPACLALPPHHRVRRDGSRDAAGIQPAAETVPAVFGNQRRDQPSTLARLAGLELTRDRRGEWSTNRCGEGRLPCPTRF